MTVGPGALKLAGGLGTLVAVGASVAVVAADTKPASAPLRPPVSSSGGTVAAIAVPSNVPSAAGDTLSIPTTPVCQKGNAGTGSTTPATPVPSAAPLSQLDPAVAAAVAQLRTARTAAARQAIMSALTADQRLQLTAYLNAHRPPPARGGGGGQSGVCKGISNQGQGGTGTVTPTVIDAGATVTPLVVSSVS